MVAAQTKNSLQSQGAHAEFRLVTYHMASSHNRNGSPAWMVARGPLSCQKRPMQPHLREDGMAPACCWLGGLLLAVLVGCVALGVAIPEAPAAEPSPIEARGSAPDVFEVRDLPLEGVFRMVRRAGALNFLVDPWLRTNRTAPELARALEAPVSFRCEKRSAREAVESLVVRQGLEWRWSAATGVGRVTHRSSPHAASDYSALLSEPALRARAATNAIARFSFRQTPLVETLAVLTRASGLNVMFDPQRLATPTGKTAMANAVDAEFHELTGLQALAGLAEGLGLGLSWNPRTTVLRVTTQDRLNWELAHPLAPPVFETADPVASQPQSLVLLDAAPLPDVLLLLCRQAGLSVLLPGSIASQPCAPEEGLKLRDISQLQLLVALVENHGLAFAPRPPAGIHCLVGWERAWNLSRAASAAASPLPAAAWGVEKPVDIALDGVPLRDALTSLARMAGLRLLVSPKAARSSRADERDESLARGSLREATPRAALTALLFQHELELVWHPVLEAAFAVPANESLLPIGGAPIPAGHWGEDLARIEFDGMPLDAALRALARQADLSVSFEPEAGGETSSTRRWPPVSLRWETASAGRVLCALCVNHRLRARWDEANRRLVVEGGTGE